MKVSILALLLFFGANGIGGVGTAAAADSFMAQKRSSAVRQLFNNLRADNIDLVDQIYSDNILFIDPLGEVRGKQSLKRYFANMLGWAAEIQFIYPHESVKQDQHTLFWTMKLKLKGINFGRPITVDGVSHIIFDPQTDMIVYQRDYFDMLNAILDYFPPVRDALKAIKSKIMN